MGTQRTDPLPPTVSVVPKIPEVYMCDKYTSKDFVSSYNKFVGHDLERRALINIILLYILPKYYRDWPHENVSCPV